MMIQRILVVLAVLMSTSCFGQSITWKHIFEDYSGTITKVIQCPDSTFVAVGLRSLPGGASNIRLTKFSASGMIVWQRFIGNNKCSGHWVEQTTDNGYIITGQIYQDSSGIAYVYLVKADSMGIVIWDRLYNNSDLDNSQCVKQTPDGGYIL